MKTARRYKAMERLATMRINRDLRYLDEWRAARSKNAKKFWKNLRQITVGIFFTCILNIFFILMLTVTAYASKTASWYGITGDTCDPWKHTRTANGEKFNENALTAASWKYHLGSLVKVTNTHNHKTVIVRINDRGPGKHLYRKGRLIDLTRGAFTKVADLRDGVIPIKISLLVGRIQ